MIVLFIIFIGLSAYFWLFLQSDTLASILILLTLLIYDVSEKDGDSFLWPKVSAILYLLMVAMLILKYVSISEKLAGLAYLLISYWAIKIVVFIFLTNIKRSK